MIAQTLTQWQHFHTFLKIYFICKNICKTFKSSFWSRRIVKTVYCSQCITQLLNSLTRSKPTVKDSCKLVFYTIIETKMQCIKTRCCVFDLTFAIRACGNTHSHAFSTDTYFLNYKFIGWSIKCKKMLKDAHHHGPKVIFRGDFLDGQGDST